MRQKIAARFPTPPWFYSKGDQSGREQLTKGKIVEPANTQGYNLARCLGTNKLLMLDENGGVVSPDTSKSSARAVGRPSGIHQKLSAPVAKEVQQALQAADGSEEVNILRLEEVAKYTFQHQLQICITLSVSHEDGSPVFAVHKKGSSSQRLKWIEAFSPKTRKLRRSC